tara:strand:- start:143 stop:496 length:354 start_codon:yes stop_codon:yes gene_type:complete
MDNHNTLEIILTINSENLGRISSTCRLWNVTTGKFREEEKMNYIHETSLAFQDQVIQNLELEMYRCASGYHNGDFYHSWREWTDDWEEFWYDYRVYGFFYDDYMRKTHQLNFTSTST